MSDIPGGGGGGTGPVANVDAAGEVSTVRIKVNGVTIEVTGKVMVREMLIKARDVGAIEGSTEYTVEKVEKEGELKNDEVIEVMESDEFLAVPTGPTPVA